MTTQQAIDDKVVRDEADMKRLRDEAKREGFDKMSDGSWFQRIVEAHIKKHAESLRHVRWDEKYPNLDVEERAHRRIKRAMRRASAAGMLASTGASTGELLSLFTEGLGAPIGLPAAILSMVSEAAYTALLQVDLACDLASIYGAPFDPDDFGELATLFGLALEVDIKKKSEEEEDADQKEAKSGVTAKLLELEDGEFAKRVGRKLLEESVMRNIIPVVGIGISARWNYVATKKFGASAKKYARYRRALRHACGKLKVDGVSDPGLLLEGAWLLATVDGEAGHEELLAMALVLESLPVTAEDKARLGVDDDEESWFERLAASRKDDHDALLDVLYLLAATDRQIQSAERRFLKRVGKSIGREIDFDRLEQFTKHLSEGDDLPAGFLRPT